MSSILKSLNTELEQGGDVLGGFRLQESDIYDSVVKMAYLGQSAGGASFVALEANTADGQTLRQDIYFTNKNGENFYASKDKAGNPTGKNAPLPGYTSVNDISLIVTGDGLSAQDVEQKVVNIYSKEAQGQVPTTVDVLVGWLGKPISIAVLKTLENKQEKDDATGRYVAIAEDIERNEMVKFFDTDSKRTVSEAIEGREASFYDQWLKANKGVTKDKRTIKGGAAAGGAPMSKAAPQGAPAGAAPAKRNLFGGAK